MLPCVHSTGPWGPTPLLGESAPMGPLVPDTIQHTHHDVQALVGGPLSHDVLDASLVDVHGPAVLDHSASNVEVLGAVYLVVAIEEVEAGFVRKS